MADGSCFKIMYGRNRRIAVYFRNSQKRTLSDWSKDIGKQIFSSSLLFLPISPFVPSIDEQVESYFVGYHATELQAHDERLSLRQLFHDVFLEFRTQSHEEGLKSPRAEFPRCQAHIKALP